jgi:leucyl-tRNA synthetase
MICKRSEKDGRLYKMSKSKGNVVAPDELIREYGADTLRLYTLFIGPPEKDAEWSDQGIEGAHRFLRRLWHRIGERLGALHAARGLKPDPACMDAAERSLHRKTHQTIRHVTHDLEGAFHFNSAIARLMELTNALDECEIGPDSGEQRKAAYLEAVEAVILMLSPFAPHFSEEIWEQLGRPPSILSVPWPSYSEAALEEEAVEVVIQVNGKVRSRIRLPVGMDPQSVEARVLAHEPLRKYLEGQTVRKVVVVPNKLVNIAV